MKKYLLITTFIYLNIGLFSFVLAEYETESKPDLYDKYIVKPLKKEQPQPATKIEPIQKEPSDTEKDNLTDYEKEQLRIQEEQLRLQRAAIALQIMQSIPKPQYTPAPNYYPKAQPSKRYNINIHPTVINSPNSPQVYQGTIEEVR